MSTDILLIYSGVFQRTHYNRISILLSQRRFESFTRHCQNGRKGGGNVIAMNMKEACNITGMGRKELTKLITSGAWDIGECIKNPKTGYTKTVIWSHKLADVMGVPEQKVLEQLERMDFEKRNHHIQ